MQNKFIDECFNEIIRDCETFGICRMTQILKNLCIMKNKLLLQRIIDYTYENTNERYNERYINELLTLADEQENTDMVDFLIEKNFTRINYMPPKIICAKYLSSINFFLSRSTDVNKINDILNCAVDNKDVKIVQLCIEKGVKCSADLFDKIYYLHEVDVKFIKFLIDNKVIANLNNGFIKICRNYNISIEIIKLFIDGGVTNLNNGFIATCRNSQSTKEVIKFFIDNGVTNLNDGFIEICQKYCINNDFFKLFIDNGITNLNDGFIEICQRYCNAELLQLFIDTGITNLDNGFLLICQNHYISLKIIKIFIENNITNLNDGFTQICLNDKAPCSVIIDIIDFFLYNNIIDKDIIKRSNINNMPLIRTLEYGMALTFRDFHNLSVADLLSVLCNHNIIRFGLGNYSLENIIKITLIDFDLMTPSELYGITYSVDNNDKQHLTIPQLIGIYSEIPDKLITNSYKRELMQCYLDRQLWKPTCYNNFPLNIKKRIFTFVLVIRRFFADKLKCKIPKPLMHMIINLFIN